MNIPKTLVCLRADGNSRIGLGHIHRLLALCDILKPNFVCKFVSQSPLPGIRELILKSCGEVIVINKLENHLHEISHYVKGNEIVVLDGYKFDTLYQEKVKRQGSKIVCIDDLHQHHFVADVVINPAGGLKEELYSKDPATKLFFGPKYSLLKRQFLEAGKAKVPKNKSLNSVFICMGGADPDNHTLEVLKRCLNYPFDSYKVVVGEAYRHMSKLERVTKECQEDIQVHSNLTSQELVDVMLQCSVGVTSASGIAYEYLSVGGELYVELTASNQRDLFSYLVDSELAFKFDNFRVDESKVIESHQKQKNIFDGNSDMRILKIFNRLDLGLHGNIRKAKADDLMTTFHWANDTELRAQSFNTKEISLENHIAWFNRRINDPATALYIFEYKELPIGQIRFDIGKEATISYSIDRAFRGRGWGQLILQNAIDTFLNERRQPIEIIGYVKQENLSSSIIFNNLGFIQSIAQDHPNAYKYQLTKL